MRDPISTHILPNNAPDPNALKPQKVNTNKLHASRELRRQTSTNIRECEKAQKCHKVPSNTTSPPPHKSETPVRTLCPPHSAREYCCERSVRNECVFRAPRSKRVHCFERPVRNVCLVSNALFAPMLVATEFRTPRSIRWNCYFLCFG